MFARRISEITSVLIIILFTYTGLSKLFNHAEFLFQLGRSPFVTRFAWPISWALPLAELGIVALLLFPQSRGWGLFGAFFLMALFTTYIYLMIQKSPWLPCSCGGVLASMNWQQHFYFNLMFTGISLGGILFLPKKAAL